MDQCRNRRNRADGAGPCLRSNSTAETAEVQKRNCFANHQSRDADALGENLRERLPIVHAPTLREMRSLAEGKSSVIENEFCGSGLVQKFNVGDGENTGSPI